MIAAIELAKQLEAANALEADLENQIAELEAGADQFAGRVAELESVVRENHEWHKAYDDAGYPDSELEKQNTEALSSDGSNVLLEERLGGMRHALAVAREYEKGRFSRGDWHGEICAAAIAQAIERAITAAKGQ